MRVAIGWFLSGLFIFGFAVGFAVHAAMESAVLEELLRDNTNLRMILMRIAGGDKVIIPKDFIGSEDGQRQERKAD